MDLFMPKDRISIQRSLQVYWPYILPFVLLPFPMWGIRALFMPGTVSIIWSVCFYALGILVLYPALFKDASNRLWIVASFGWLVSFVLAMQIPVVAMLQGA